MVSANMERQSKKEKDKLLEEYYIKYAKLHEEMAKDWEFCLADFDI